MIPQLELDTIHIGNAIAILKTFPDNSIHCVVTSPPYWALRKYGNSFDEIGMEKTPQLYIAKLMEVFKEIFRVLRKDGTLWVNIADTYYGGKGANGASVAYKDSDKRLNNKALVSTAPGETRPQDAKIPGLKPKDLVGIPWMLAFALRDYGFYLRQDIIWHKPNPMPESVTDRCTKSHEYVFLLSKSHKYYFDAEAIKTLVQDSTVQRMAQQVEAQKGSERVPGKTNGTMKAVGPGKTVRENVDTRGGNQGSQKGIPAMAVNGSINKNGHSGYFDKAGNLIGGGYANKKSVWSVTTKPFNEAHYATFPEDLPIDMIKAGCRKGGIVLDPFVGAGTVPLVAKKLERHFVGIELYPANAKIIKKRMNKELGMFDTTTFKQ